MYVLDSDVFLQAKNRHYGLDFCPGFWNWLLTSNADGVLQSIDKVKAELKDPDITAWVDGTPDGFFVSSDDAATLAAMRTVATWVTGAGYTPAAIAEFFASADYYLISFALAHGCTVVTHEVAANTVNKVKIPNACDALGVACIDPFTMLRDENARFVVEAAGAQARGAVPIVGAHAPRADGDAAQDNAHLLG